MGRSIVWRWRVLRRAAVPVVLLCSAALNAGCASASNASTVPFSAPQVITAFGRHHLKVEKFTRATNCPPVCATAKGIPLAATELQFTGSRRAFVFDVLVYRTEADAKRVISPALLKNGKDLLRVRIRYLRHGNIVVTYVGDTSRALPAIQKLFEEPGAKLKAIQASLTSLALPH